MGEFFDDLFRLEERLWLITRHQDLAIYDFDFARYFRIHHQFEPPRSITAIARIGAFDDYVRQTRDLEGIGISLVNSLDEHDRCSELRAWYPLLQDLTPKSIVFDDVPDVGRIGAELGWPIFVKGSRQTSHHRKSLAIIDNPERLRHALEEYERDDVLHWQKVVCREFVSLRPVEQVEHYDRLPSSFEFRTFWWHRQLVGFGRYWWEGKDYTPTAEERKGAIAVATEAARRVKVPFLVVDVAQTATGRWLVIECNDAQESGYAGVSPFALWQNVLDLSTRPS